MRAQSTESDRHARDAREPVDDQADHEIVLWQSRPQSWRVFLGIMPGVAGVLPVLIFALVAGMIISTDAGDAVLTMFGHELFRISNAGVVVGPLVVGAVLFMMTLPLRSAIVVATTTYQLTNNRLLARNRIFQSFEWQIPADKVRAVERHDVCESRANLIIRTKGPLGAGASERLIGVGNPDVAIDILGFWHGVSVVETKIRIPEGNFELRRSRAISGELEPFERIIWKSATSAKAAFPEVIPPMIFYSSIIIIFNAPFLFIFFNAGASGYNSDNSLFENFMAGGALKLLSIPFCLSILIIPYMLVSEFWRQATSMVAISDRRFIVAQGWRRIATTSVFPETIKDARTLNYRADGRASLKLTVKGPNNLSGIDGSFHGIVDPDGADAAMEKLMAGVRG